jgi:hypothetical protein
MMDRLERARVMDSRTASFSTARCGEVPCFEHGIPRAQGESMTPHDQVRIRLLEESFVYAIFRRGLEIESAEVPLRPVSADMIIPEVYYGGSEVMD